MRVTIFACVVVAFAPATPSDGVLRFGIAFCSVAIASQNVQKLVFGHHATPGDETHAARATAGGPHVSPSISSFYLADNQTRAQSIQQWSF